MIHQNMRPYLYFMSIALPVLAAAFFLFSCFKSFTPVILKRMQKEKPLVSVVMPTYNRAGRMPRALESILAQTYENFEIIIVNDGSKDNTAEVLQKYAAEDSRIKILTNNPNRGVAYSRQHGNEAAQGKYIAIMDDDDLVLPNWLEASVAFMEQNEDVIVGYPNAYFFNYSILYSESPFPKLNPWRLRYNNVIQNMGNIIRRDFIINHNIRYKDEIGLGEDYDFWIQILTNYGKIRKIPLGLVVIHHDYKNYPPQYKGKFGVPQASSHFDKFLFPKSLENESSCKKWYWLKKTFVGKKEILSQEALNELFIKDCMTPPTEEKKK